MAVLPDLQYVRQREALLRYEDSLFNALLAGVPDNYPTLNDYTLYGSILRAMAMELARLEYRTSYRMVALEPQYLTPPDIKRRFAAPLFINKSYPTEDQTDTSFQQMLVALLSAYPEGATLQAIEDVVEAYTGQTVPIQELYKEIGKGIYDETDRNTLKMVIDATTSTALDPFDGVLSAAALATLSQNIYAAIDLAKPAHVGLDLSLTFGSAENVLTRIREIVDHLELLYYGVEAPALPVVFTQSPYFDPKSPDTRLIGMGKLVSDFMSETITSQQYAALMSDDFRYEYGMNADGSFSLMDDSLEDIVLLDANFQPTGVISRGRGVLAPQLEKTWEIKSDTLTILRLS